jgi:hypothetical protein
MVFDAIFNNISVISRWSVLLVENTGVPGKNHRPVANHWQTLSHNVVSSHWQTLSHNVVSNHWQTLSHNVVSSHWQTLSHNVVSNHWQTLSHNVVSSTPRLSGIKLATSIVIGKGSCKSNYHMTTKPRRPLVVLKKKNVLDTVMKTYFEKFSKSLNFIC